MIFKIKGLQTDIVGIFPAICSLFSFFFIVFFGKLLI